MAVDADMWARSGRERQIPTHDRRPPFDRDVLQKDAFAPTAHEHCPAVGRPNVAHPVCPLTEHGDEIALAIPVGIITGDERRRPVPRPTTSSAAAHLGPIPAPKAIADVRFSNRAEALGRRPRYAQRR